VSFKESTFTEGLALYKESIFNKDSFLFLNSKSSLMLFMIVMFNIQPQMTKYNRTIPSIVIAKVLDIFFNITNNIENFNEVMQWQR